MERNIVKRAVRNHHQAPPADSPFNLIEQQIIEQAEIMARSPCELIHVTLHSRRAIAQRVDLKSQPIKRCLDFACTSQMTDHFNVFVGDQKGEYFIIEAEVFDERRVFSELPLKFLNIRQIDARKQMAAALLKLAHDFKQFA